MFIEWVFLIKGSIRKLKNIYKVFLIYKNILMYIELIGNLKKKFVEKSFF